MLATATFIYRTQQVRYKMRINNKHTCKLINAFNSMDGYKLNETVQNWDRVKPHQINKHPNKDTTTKS